MPKRALSEISDAPAVRFKVARVSRPIAVFRFEEGLDSMGGLDVKISEQILWSCQVRDWQRHTMACRRLIMGCRQRLTMACRRRVTIPSGATCIDMWTRRTDRSYSPCMYVRVQDSA
jgi:hypothetical protein